ncbi:MarR family winged helix-turn-helix transcriptional regulator [Streptomyces sp. ME109]|uniref:MarR family winged helix-turn-helix transcriptional regulator n=1 Tax=Streptomyces sp. me109 TaxID=1827853 RepID=UPI0016517F3C|nr:MarR family winged helix-turn-helix transcriptional regulator [Streptomyces sp. me109]
MTDSTSSGLPQGQAPGILWTLGRLHGELRLRHGLSLHGYLILGVLAGTASGSATVAELTAFLGESGDRMSYLLKGVQASGLIERGRRERDRRTVQVTLTGAGRDLYAEAESTARSIVGRHLPASAITAVAPCAAPASPTS